MPVLSNTMVSMVLRRSKVSPPLIRIPFLADRPMPTATAVGVAKPMAHGQEITSTAILLRSEAEVFKSKK